MADVFSKQKRSEVMSRIRSRGNQATELALVRLLRKNKITGWRRHLLIRATVDSAKLKVESQHTSPRPSPRRGESARRGKDPQPSTKNHQLAVRPDFVFRKSRTALFVDGCFWHGCPKHGTQPAGNRVFWKKKFACNLARDRLVNASLRRTGWRILRIWEHELSMKNEARLLRRLKQALRQRQTCP